jgi:hypothetical protein
MAGVSLLGNRNGRGHCAVGDQGGGVILDRRSRFEGSVPLLRDDTSSVSAGSTGGLLEVNPRVEKGGTTPGASGSRPCALVLGAAHSNDTSCLFSKLKTARLTWVEVSPVPPLKVVAPVGSRPTRLLLRLSSRDDVVTRGCMRLLSIVPSRPGRRGPMPRYWGCPLSNNE